VTRATFALGAIARLRLTVCVFFSCVACTSTVPKQRTFSSPAVRTERFITLKGADTVASELVTTCPGRVIADIDNRVPKAHIHYQFEFGSTRRPSSLTIAVWRAGDAVTGRPTQLARTTVVGDSVLTEVWRGQDHQLQESSPPTRLVSLVWGLRSFDGPAFSASRTGTDAARASVFRRDARPYGPRPG